MTLNTGFIVFMIVIFLADSQKFYRVKVKLKTVFDLQPETYKASLKPNAANVVAQTFN